MGLMDKFKGIFGKDEDDYSGVPISLEGMEEEEEEEDLVEPEIGFLPSDAEIPSSTIEQQLEGAKQLGFDEYIESPSEVPVSSGLTEEQVEIADIQSRMVDAEEQIAKDEEEEEERAEMEREWELRKRAKDPNYTPDYNIVPEEESTDFAQLSEEEQTRLWELREKELLIGEEEQYPMRGTPDLETSVSEEVETQVVYPKPEEGSIPIHGPLMQSPEEDTPMAARSEIAKGVEEAEEEAKKISSMPAIQALARRIYLGYEDLSPEETRLQQNYPREIETEIVELKRLRDEGIAEKAAKIYEEPMRTEEESRREFELAREEWLKSLTEVEASVPSESGILDKVKAELIEQLIEIPRGNGEWVREMSDDAVQKLMAKWKGMTTEELRVEKQRLKEIDEMRSESVKTHKERLAQHESEVKQRAFDAGLKMEQEQAERKYKKKYGTPEEKAEIERLENLEKLEIEKKKHEAKREIEFGKQQIQEIAAETKKLGTKESKDKLSLDFMEEIGKALEAAYQNPKRGQPIIKEAELLMKMAELSTGVTPELKDKARRLRERAERKHKERAEQFARGVGKTMEAAIKHSDKPVQAFAKATKRGGEGYKRQWGEQGAQKILGQSPIIPEGAQTRRPLMASLPGEPKLKESPVSTAGIKEQAALATGRSMMDTRRGISVGPAEPAGVLGTPAGGAKYMIGGPKQRMDVAARDLDVFDFIGSRSRPLDTGVQAVTAAAGIPATPGLYVSGTPSIKRMDVKQLL